jgi:hypothetical protein
VSLNKGSNWNTNPIGGADVGYELTGSHTKIDEHTHTMSTSVYFGVTTTMSLDVKVPLLGDAGFSMSLERSLTVNNEDSDTHVSLPTTIF